MSITQQHLKEILNYDKLTGSFVWRKKTSSKTVIGRVAGCLDGRGYVVIRIHKRLYRAHRLAWIYVYGEEPGKDIDHINRIKWDNRIENLRLATRSENMCNTPKREDNKSGLKGVMKARNYNSWIAQARLNGKNHYLGSFKSKEQAHHAYMAFRKKNNGQFASS